MPTAIVRCIHCAAAPGSYPRGLCRFCWNQPVIRDRYLPTFFGNRSDAAGLPRDDLEARITALAARARANRPLFGRTDRNTAEERGERVSG